jgi:hypothetical protein
MPVLFAASRLATAVLAQIRSLRPNCIHLQRPTASSAATATSSGAATSSTNARNPLASHHTPHPRRSNPYSARRTSNVPPPAVSSLAGFRTPAPARAEPFVAAGIPKPSQLGASSCAASNRRLGPRAAIAQAHSITSSAASGRPSGMFRPSILAVLRLITSSNLVGSWTGRSPGFSPLRIRPA